VYTTRPFVENRGGSGFDLSRRKKKERREKDAHLERKLMQGCLFQVGLKEGHGYHIRRYSKGRREEKIKPFPDGKKKTFKLSFSGNDEGEDFLEDHRRSCLFFAVWRRGGEGKKRRATLVARRTGPREGKTKGCSTTRSATVGKSYSIPIVSTAGKKKKGRGRTLLVLLCWIVFERREKSDLTKTNPPTQKKTEERDQINFENTHPTTGEKGRKEKKKEDLPV